MEDRLKQIKVAISEFTDFLQSIATTSPVVFDTEFHKKLNHIANMSLTIPQKRSDLMKCLFDNCAEELDKSTMQAHSRNKPLGYAGDFLIIDWIYTRKTDSKGVGKLWDEFYHRQAAPQAVRNRKDFFCKTFEILCQKYQNGLSVLNLASGPCRDISEAIKVTSLEDKKLHFHCVDTDKRAIDYAKNIVNGGPSNISFYWEVGSVFRIRPSIYYDLVWSAGLFDYLDDRQAIVLLKKMWRWTNNGGKIIIGNFHPRNPSRNYMEWTGGWFVIHRTEDDLLKLCVQAGIPIEHISFDQEPLGVNLFCVIKKE